VSKTESSGKALDQIIAMAGSVGEMVMQIAASTTQQNTTAETVNGHITLISEMTTQASINAHETARACADLTDLATRLQEVVNHFKFQSHGKS